MAMEMQYTFHNFADMIAITWALLLRIQIVYNMAPVLHQDCDKVYNNHMG